VSTVSDDLEREIWGSFGSQQYVFLATAEGEKPRVRPVTLLHFRKKLYFVTGSRDAKTQQIKRNPRVEFCLLLEKGDHKGTLRGECVAHIVEDKKLKADVFNEVSFVKEFFDSPEDSGYALVWLKPVGLEYMKPGEMQAVKVKL
jgi:uncharacterized pyridoxamine 5'-phosphate oxidase family protein